MNHGSLLRARVTTRPARRANDASEDLIGRSLWSLRPTES